ncbi:MAG: hypothetical protein ACJ77N_05970 [Chloroflexota bacterium]|jgi:hypothetical protein
MNDEPASPDDTQNDDEGAGGADAPDASLVARIANSTTPQPPRGGGNPGDLAGSAVPSHEQSGAVDTLGEGDESAARSGRVDAGAATFGPDPGRDRVAGGALGGPPHSVGGGMDTPSDADTGSAGDLDR